MSFQEVKERQFLLFPTVLVLLSVSEDISGYCFEVTGPCMHAFLTRLKNVCQSVCIARSNTRGDHFLD